MSKKKYKNLDESIEAARQESIDEQMIPYIAELWLKGYVTRQCCAGHVGRKEMRPYIYWQTGNELTPDQFDELAEIQKSRYPSIKFSISGIELMAKARTGSMESKKKQQKIFFDFIKEVLCCLKSKDIC